MQKLRSLAESQFRGLMEDLQAAQEFFTGNGSAESTKYAVHNAVKKLQAIERKLQRLEDMENVAMYARKQLRGTVTTSEVRQPNGPGFWVRTNILVTDEEVWENTDTGKSVVAKNPTERPGRWMTAGEIAEAQMVLLSQEEGGRT